MAADSRCRRLLGVLARRCRSQGSSETQYPQRELHSRAGAPIRAARSSRPRTSKRRHRCSLRHRRCAMGPAAFRSRSPASSARGLGPGGTAVHHARRSGLGRPSPSRALRPARARRTSVGNQCRNARRGLCRTSPIANPLVDRRIHCRPADRPQHKPPTQDLHVGVCRRHRLVRQSRRLSVTRGRDRAVPLLPKSSDTCRAPATLARGAHDRRSGNLYRLTALKRQQFHPPWQHEMPVLELTERIRDLDLQ